MQFRKPLVYAPLAGFPVIALIKFECFARVKLPLKGASFGPAIVFDSAGEVAKFEGSIEQKAKALFLQAEHH
jgi:hypothetical protein